MQKKKIILFGNDKALKSPRALEIKGLLDELGHEVLVLPRPALLKSLTDWKNLPFDWALLIVEAGSAPPATAPWLEVFKLMRHPPFFASWSPEPLPKSYIEELQCEFTFVKTDESKEILKTLGLRESTQIASDHYLVEGDLKLSELSEKLFDESKSGINTAAFLEEAATNPSFKNLSSSQKFNIENTPDEPHLSMNTSEIPEISRIQGMNDSSPSLNLNEDSAKIDIHATKPKDIKKPSATISSIDDLDEFGGEGDATFIRDMKVGLTGAPTPSLKTSNEEQKLNPEAEDSSLNDALNLSISNASSGDPLKSLDLNSNKEKKAEAKSPAPKNAPEKSATPPKPAGKSFLEKASKLFDDISKSIAPAPPPKSKMKIEAPSESFNFNLNDDLADNNNSLLNEDSHPKESFNLDELDNDKLSASESLSSSESLSASSSVSKPLTKIKEVPSKLSRDESVLFTNTNRNIEERDSDPEDIKTIKRYAALKEREAREKQASLVAIRKEFDKLFEKLKKSDEERRRLQMQNDELELQMRTTNDKKDEVQHQWTRMETHLQENIKELQIRLDSAQYQANKAEKKLDDFRERVKNDIQKIRTRERELANRLELQKRDAEALLMTKDERLLQQKRDIDRLEFELDSLRERLFEESERSEERVKRLNRVIQSLKLAQGLLSGLDDPMNEGSSDPNKGKGEAA
ncbi:MAG: hypothetical protein KA116_00275 [Proteobacteria bacterium]|nr:hypothetical protein [Pseudomonadota bacterium]